MTNPKIKVCNRCKKKLPIIEFNKKLNGVQPYCKICDREASRARYKANSSSHKLAVQKRNQEYYKRNFRFIWEYKLTHPCVDCGESNPIVLEFDHLRDKIQAVSVIVYRDCTSNLALIKDEISKCDIVCANCHKLRTAKRAGYYKLLEKDSNLHTVKVLD